MRLNRIKQPSVALQSMSKQIVWNDRTYSSDSIKDLLDFLELAPDALTQLWNLNKKHFNDFIAVAFSRIGGKKKDSEMVATELKDNLYLFCEAPESSADIVLIFEIICLWFLGSPHFNDVTQRQRVSYKGSLYLFYFFAVFINRISYHPLLQEISVQKLVEMFNVIFIVHGNIVMGYHVLTLMANFFERAEEKLPVLRDQLCDAVRQQMNTLNPLLLRCFQEKAPNFYVRIEADIPLGIRGFKYSEVITCLYNVFELALEQEKENPVQADQETQEELDSFDKALETVKKEVDSSENLLMSILRLERHYSKRLNDVTQSGEKPSYMLDKITRWLFEKTTSLMTEASKPGSLALAPSAPPCPEKELPVVRMRKKLLAEETPFSSFVSQQLSGNPINPEFLHAFLTETSIDELKAVINGTDFKGVIDALITLNYDGIFKVFFMQDYCHRLIKTAENPDQPIDDSYYETVDGKRIMPHNWGSFQETYNVAWIRFLFFTCNENLFFRNFDGNYFFPIKKDSRLKQVSDLIRLITHAKYSPEELVNIARRNFHVNDGYIVLVIFQILSNRKLTPKEIQLTVKLMKDFMSVVNIDDLQEGVYREVEYNVENQRRYLISLRCFLEDANIELMDVFLLNKMTYRHFAGYGRVELVYLRDFFLCLTKSVILKIDTDLLLKIFLENLIQKGKYERTLGVSPSEDPCGLIRKSFYSDSEILLYLVYMMKDSPDFLGRCLASVEKLLNTEKNEIQKRLSKKGIEVLGSFRDLLKTYMGQIRFALELKNWPDLMHFKKVSKISLFEEIFGYRLLSVCACIETDKDRLSFQALLSAFDHAVSTGNFRLSQEYLRTILHETSTTYQAALQRVQTFFVEGPITTDELRGFVGLYKKHQEEDPDLIKVTNNNTYFQVLFNSIAEKYPEFNPVVKHTSPAPVLFDPAQSSFITTCLKGVSTFDAFWKFFQSVSQPISASSDLSLGNQHTRAPSRLSAAVADTDFEASFVKTIETFSYLDNYNSELESDFLIKFCNFLFKGIVETFQVPGDFQRSENFKNLQTRLANIASMNLYLFLVKLIELGDVSYGEAPFLTAYTTLLLALPLHQIGVFRETIQLVIGLKTMDNAVKIKLCRDYIDTMLLKADKDSLTLDELNSMIETFLDKIPKSRQALYQIQNLSIVAFMKATFIVDLVQDFNAIYLKYTCAALVEIIADGFDYDSSVIETYLKHFNIAYNRANAQIRAAAIVKLELELRNQLSDPRAKMMLDLVINHTTSELTTGAFRVSSSQETVFGSSSISNPNPPNYNTLENGNGVAASTSQP